MSLDAPKTDEPEARAQIALGFFDGVIGTPDDAVAYLEALEAKSGGFGTFLLLAHD
jgi:limonene 1,2-monooxygenase